MSTNVSEIIANLATRMAEAEKEFDRDARKLGVIPDKIRKQVYLVSAGYSVHHEVFQHGDVDQEPLLRARILQQSLDDFFQMMSSFENIRPKCPRCRMN